MKKYNWWGEVNEPPAHLKTKKQLAKIGLRPAQAVGIIETRKYDLLLYDPTNPQSVKPKRQISDKQKEALKKGIITQKYKAWYRNIGWLYEDRNYAIEWSKSVINNDDYLILDTETTGLYEAEIVQIGIINMAGEIVLDSLVKPTVEIPDEASAVHNINDADVVMAPAFPEIYPHIKSALDKKQVIIYNANFDRQILNYCCRLHKLPVFGLQKRSHCAMEWYAQYYGERRYGSYKWQPLNGGHNAISDCKACLNLIKEMANNEIKSLKEIFEEEKMQ